MLVTLFDTRVSDNNLGNTIIMESVDMYLRELFPQAFFIRLPCLDPLGSDSLHHVSASDHVFFGGTNVLSSDMLAYRQWALEDATLDRVRNVVLMGVGWWQYQDDPTPYTADVLRRVLHPERLHSVRDSYTKAKLEAAGIGNVLVTGCPTMWGLTPEHCRAIPKSKAPAVLATLSNYSQFNEPDKAFLDLLCRRYERIFLWVQGPEDEAYARSLCPKAEIVAPRLQSLDALLASPLELDYVGTRLHAGIRAMQFKRRSIILGVDNRALEKARDFNLPVVPRDDLAQLETAIKQPVETCLRLPWEDIKAWLGQFTQTRATDPARMPVNASRALLADDYRETARTAPVSRVFGLERGTPIDRHFIEGFLAKNSRAIAGRVLEIGDPVYTKRFGDKHAQSDVLHCQECEGATIVGDLTTGENIPREAFDCILLIQTLNVLADPFAALRSAFAALKPGGTLLLTAPGITQVSRYDMDRWGDYWRFTDRSLRLLAEQAGAWASVRVESFGNVYVAKAFLDGLCLEELDQAALDPDPDYQVLLALAAVKAPAAAPGP